VDGHLVDGSEGRSDARAALAYSAIGIWLLFDFGRQFNKPPDRFSTIQCREGAQARNRKIDAETKERLIQLRNAEDGPVDAAALFLV
jgi:hypothetical protein